MAPRVMASISICSHAGPDLAISDSTITSLIYATFTFIFFAIEAAILASVLQSCFGFLLGIGYIICSLSIVPLVTHGITFISRVQLWSQPIWLVLQVLPFVAIALTVPHALPGPA